MKRIKEFLNQAFEKWIVGIMIAALLLIGTALRDYFVRFYSAPERIEKLEARIKQDSMTYMAMWKKHIHQEDSINGNCFYWLNENYKDIFNIKKKLKMK